MRIVQNETEVNSPQFFLHNVKEAMLLINLLFNVDVFIIINIHILIII